MVDVRIGLGYTVAKLDDGSVGVSYTLRGEDPRCCSVCEDAGNLTGSSAVEVAKWLIHPDPARTSVGMAVVNALSDSNTARSEGDDIIELLRLGQEDEVAMVGFFRPLVFIKQRVKKLFVFDESDHGYGVLPPSEIKKHLPNCSIVIITAVTVINGTFDDIILLCRSPREVVLLGPTTPIYPALFEKHGVTWLSGIKIKDSDRLLRIISEGGGTKQFGKTVERINVRLVQNK